MIRAAPALMWEISRRFVVAHRHSFSPSSPFFVTPSPFSSLLLPFSSPPRCSVVSSSASPSSSPFPWRFPRSRLFSPARLFFHPRGDGFARASASAAARLSEARPEPRANFSVWTRLHLANAFRVRAFRFHPRPPLRAFRLEVSAILSSLSSSTRLVCRRTSITISRTPRSFSADIISAYRASRACVLCVCASSFISLRFCASRSASSSRLRASPSAVSFRLSAANAREFRQHLATIAHASAKEWRHDERTRPPLLAIRLDASSAHLLVVRLRATFHLREIRSHRLRSRRERSPSRADGTVRSVARIHIAGAPESVAAFRGAPTPSPPPTQPPPWRACRTRPEPPGRRRTPILVSLRPTVDALADASAAAFDLTHLLVGDAEACRSSSSLHQRATRVVSGGGDLVGDPRLQSSSSTA